MSQKTAKNGVLWKKDNFSMWSRSSLKKKQNGPVQIAEKFRELIEYLSEWDGISFHFLNFCATKKIQTKTKNLNIQKTGFILPPFNETHLSRAAQSFPQNFQTQTDESDK